MLADGIDEGKVTSPGGWTAFLYRYNPGQAAQNLREKLGYWLSEREPIPVREAKCERWANKCRACPFNAAELCEPAMTKPDPAFEVHRDGNGRVQVSR
jgi:hypothetical protein